MKWEYKIIKFATRGFTGGKFNEVELESLMNELGAQGWELTSAFDTNQAHGESRDVVIIFKRPQT